MNELVRLIEFPCYKEDESNLVAIEGSSKEVPFSIARVFHVKDKIGSKRGRHAHYQCTQLLICTNGSIEVICDDGNSIKQYILDKPNFGLIVKPGIWAEQKYLEDNSILTVLCDRHYEENDYIYDYDEIKKIERSRF